MPAELESPTGMFPFYYDRRYEHGPENYQNVGTSDLDSVIINIATSELGYRLSQGQLKDIKYQLDSMGFLNKSFDESFVNAIKSMAKKFDLARKVAHAYTRFK